MSDTTILLLIEHDAGVHADLVMRRLSSVPMLYAVQAPFAPLAIALFTHDSTLQTV